MAKSSSIYMGEGKMALSGKWESALSACMVVFFVAMIPTFAKFLLENDTVEDVEQLYEISSTKIFLSLFSFIWSVFVLSPLSFACFIGLRQMHISDESPLDVMIKKIKKNYSKYIVLIFKVALRILVVTAIPLIIYTICIFKYIMDYGNLAPSSQYEGIASLCSLTLFILFFYKVFEFTFVPFIQNDNPDLSDNEILDKSSKLSKGYKWTMFKIMLRAILPAFAIIFVLLIALFFVSFGTLIGGIAAFSAGYDFSNFSFDSLGTTFIFIIILIMSLLYAFILTRTILPFSVLYSELIGYNGNAQNNQENTPAIVETPDSEENKENTTNEEEKKEDKKDEPEIPYEQRYMPKY